MRTLLSVAGPLPDASKVKFHGVDNYTDTIPLEKALDPTTLVVYEMNGEPLPHRHGFPARVIVPGYFGEKHVKWITRIELAKAMRRVFTRSRVGVRISSCQSGRGSISQSTTPGLCFRS